MADFVVDASVVLAALKGEPGSDLAQSLVANSVICAVNAAEVVAKLVDWGYSAETAITEFAQFGLEIIVADEGLAVAAGLLRAQTRHLGLSMGDRFCLALGRRLSLPIYTADRSWVALSPSLDIRLIR